MKNTLLTSIARHLLQWAAASLATWGMLKSDTDKDAFVEIGAGIVVGLLTQAWSIWEKRQIKTAVAIEKVGDTQTINKLSTQIVEDGKTPVAAQQIQPTPETVALAAKAGVVTTKM